MDGVYVLYGSLGGFRTEVDLRVLMRKRITIAASTLRARSLDYKVRQQHQLRIVRSK